MPIIGRFALLVPKGVVTYYRQDLRPPHSLFQFRKTGEVRLSGRTSSLLLMMIREEEAAAQRIRKG